MYFTYRPIEWDDYMKRAWGEEKYWRIRRQAQAITKHDKEALYDELRARLKEIQDGANEPGGHREPMD
jgi:hypothetical protein